ncbi:hypothetical protein SAY86_021928 [Trapa natans]|uniref:Gnk2-homologous domain-containing protein n=1 Tax=Trapa natans TaxID=22666 RepID=A0AAN7MVH8_TRANT|nr:hypothetical protein SAY86_021928 [Trapa natans]
METSTMLCHRADRLILLIITGFLLPSAEPNPDFATMVYKDCANDTFTDPYVDAASSHDQMLASMFDELVSHSLQSKFYRTTRGDDHGSITGFYQCKRDITAEDCHGCVAKLPEISNSLCSRSMAAKVQFSGCSLRYIADSFPQEKDHLTPGVIRYEEEHMFCSSECAETGMFDELRDQAFEEVENELEIGHGYSSAEKEGFHAEAECEEDMEEMKCRECVSAAVENAKDRCEKAIRGEVYLKQCSVTYEYREHRRECESGCESEHQREGEGKPLPYHTDLSDKKCLLNPLQAPTP